MWFLEYLAVNANHRFTVSDLKVENVNQTRSTCIFDGAPGLGAEFEQSVWEQTRKQM